MEFLDNAVTKAKEVFEVAYKKTGEAVNLGKQKLDIAAIENKRSKDFEALGKLYFETIDETEGLDYKIVELVEAIKEKNAKIKEIEDELNAQKNTLVCPNCGAHISSESLFCNACGTKLSSEE